MHNNNRWSLLIKRQVPVYVHTYTVNACNIHYLLCESYFRSTRNAIAYWYYRTLERNIKKKLLLFDSHVINHHLNIASNVVNELESRETRLIRKKGLKKFIELNMRGKYFLK